VIGVNTQIATGSPTEAGNVGIGFAIPINTVKNVVRQLRREGRVDHADLGLQAQELNAEIAELFRLPAKEGLLVVNVEDGGGAAEAGVRAGETQVVVAGASWVLGGDILVRADGRPLVTLSDLQRAVAAKKPGESMKLELYRGEEKQTVSVVLSRRSG
jgi:S1-C subfamily serine protease